MIEQWLAVLVVVVFAEVAVVVIFEVAELAVVILLACEVAVAGIRTSIAFRSRWLFAGAAAEEYT